jgi:hypothetical protein
MPEIKTGKGSIGNILKKIPATCQAEIMDLINLSVYNNY